jgi:hypothetical protein
MVESAGRRGNKYCGPSPVDLEVRAEARRTSEVPHRGQGTLGRERESLCLAVPGRRQGLLLMREFRMANAAEQGSASQALIQMWVFFE